MEAKAILKNGARFAVLALLRGYKLLISPVFASSIVTSSIGPVACRYTPTCSEYAMEAVERYGVLRGGWMAVARILRCHPFGGSGYDPVIRRTSENKTLNGRTGAAPETVAR